MYVVWNDLMHPWWQPPRGVSIKARHTQEKGTYDTALCTGEVGTQSSTSMLQSGVPKTNQLPYVYICRRSIKFMIPIIYIHTTMSLWRVKWKSYGYLSRYYRRQRYGPRVTTTTRGGDLLHRGPVHKLYLHTHAYKDQQRENNDTLAPSLPLLFSHRTAASQQRWDCVSNHVIHALL